MAEPSVFWSGANQLSVALLPVAEVVVVDARATVADEADGGATADEERVDSVVLVSEDTLSTGALVPESVVGASESFGTEDAVAVAADVSFAE